jgi:hypothetical protein
MIFISVERRRSGVFFATNPYHPFGDFMTKSGTLIITALLTVGLAAASMAADAPKSSTPVAADTSTAAPAPATKSKSSKSSKSGSKSTKSSSKSGSKSTKSGSKSTKPAAAPATAK